jgi:signal transduction histidine kinase
LVIGTYTYYIITSWKNLTGAQWSVLVGVILVFVFGLTISIVSMAMPYNYIFILLLTSGVYLAFPVCLLIYVATRFKEIMIETQRRAKQVVQLSEQKKEQALQQQKILEEEVARQTVELRTSLENLKSTQTQLIQSEKMASLGELTAGIAHEIQNPLNFVNNFSEVSSELLDEIKSELDKGDIKEAKAITDDVKQNLEKITHHGKRADAIVKSMLQHSRKSSGQKDPVDINALVDEYLRLSYHGFRAKDKSFNAIIETHFDPNIDHASVVGQEIGRVLLNLFNNAFYAISEKKKIQQNDFEPAIQVTTHKMKDGIEIKVRDNGMGIPQKVLDKIFQPFFTTKPTGEGTGLGLSLSYDIITKGHGGELKVETKEGKGSEFIIQLPLN